GPSEKLKKAKAEQAKEEIAAASTKKALHGKKEEKAKTVEQEVKKEKSGKSSSDLKDKEVKKEKSGKSSSDLKDKEPQLKNEEKSKPQVKKEAKLASSDKGQTRKQNITRPEQVIPHVKPEKAEHQEKGHPSIKKDKPKPSSKGAPEVPDSGKKKIEKSEKESKVPTREENLQVYNVTKAEKPGKIPKDSKEAPASKKDKEDSKEAPTSKKDKEDSKDVPHSKKDKEVTDDVSSPKKQTRPISFFQCVYLNGYNGYGFQFPVTPVQQPGENPGKTNSPGQKQQEQ
ncbi:mCG19195, isoform CRA_b, partial [Mus musculus]